MFEHVGQVEVEGLPVEFSVAVELPTDQVTCDRDEMRALAMNDTSDEIQSHHSCVVVFAQVQVRKLNNPEVAIGLENDWVIVVLALLVKRAGLSGHKCEC